MVGSPEVGKYGFSYISFNVKSDGGKYAVPLDPALPARDLDPDETRMWRLDLDAVRRTLAADLQTEPAPPEPLLEGRALDLGLARGVGIDLRILALLRSPGTHAREIVDAMVRAAGRAHLVVLLPDGRTFGAGLDVPLSIAELFGGVSCAAKVIERVAEKKNLPRGFAGLWRLAGPGVRFIADEETLACCFDGHTLEIPETGRRVLIAIGKGGGEPVRSAVVGGIVAPRRVDDGAVRQTVRKLGAWIRGSFQRAGVQPPKDADALVEWVTNRGWRMTVKSEVR
jgi:hypothetical protein